jgi:short-subunit dehydrogenase
VSESVGFRRFGGIVGGANLVLTARRARRLANLRTRLRAMHGVRIKVLAADLAQPNTAAEITATPTVTVWVRDK